MDCGEECINNELGISDGGEEEEEETGHPGMMSALEGEGVREMRI